MYVHRFLMVRALNVMTGFLALSLIGSAQAGRQYDTDWVTKFGTDSYDQSYSMVVDSVGNVYMSGYTNGDLGGTNAGDADAFLTKLDTSGNVLWSQQIGSALMDRSFSVAVDSLGNAYIGGYTYGGLTGPVTGPTDAFITKYDASGNEVWTRQFGTESQEQEGYVTTDSMGNVYYTSSFYLAYGSQHPIYSDVNLIKFDSSGNECWYKKFDEIMEYDNSRSVTVDSSGNLYITGFSSGAYGGDNSGVYNPFLIKCDASGNELWTKQIDTPYREESYSVVVDDQGNAYICGYGESRDGSSADGMDVFLMKFDSSGNELWFKQINSPGNDFSLDLALDDAGNPYLSGYTPGSIGGDNAGRLDAFFVKYDPTGQEIWFQQFGSTVDDYCTAIDIDSAGSVYISGYTYGTLGGPSIGKTDLYVTKLTPIPEPTSLMLFGLGIPGLMVRRNKKRN